MGTRLGFAIVVVVCCLATTVLTQNEIVEDVNKLSRANAFFADKIYKQLSRNSTNLVFSPLSISVALSMLNAGAKGNTFQELNTTLGFSFAQLNEQELQQGYQNMVTSLTEPRDGYQFSLANAQFLQRSFPIYSNYTRIIVEDFHAESDTVDFGNKAETLRRINGWVSDATRNKITSILEDVTPFDVMALVNAVYFKGQWVNKFDERSTADIDFFTENGTRKIAKMMIRDVSAKYNAHHQIGASVLELPYEGNFFSMIFVLPETGKSLSQLEESLTHEFILHVSDDLTLQNISVGIPKIKLESSVYLIDHLRALGIEKVFTDAADLSGISPDHLKVTQAVHKATVDINEEGSEASAATVVVTSTRIGSIRPYFWANRPYMFILRHNPSNTVCFMGKVADV